MSELRRGAIKANRFQAALRRRGNKWNERRGIRKAGAGITWFAWRSLSLWRHPMARSRRTRVFLIAARWEVQRRRAPQELVATLPLGATLICPPWTGSSRALLCLGLEDFEEQTFLLDTLGPDDVALDVGAHLGMYTIVMASRGAVVHAFEPSPLIRGVLTRSIAGNDFMQPVTVHPIALSDFTGSATFTDGLGSGNRLIGGRATTFASPEAVDVETLDRTLEIEVTTLDRWAEAYDLANLFVIKVDVEGADESVLVGAAAVLEKYEPVLIIEFWNDARALRSFLAPRGYEVYRYLPRERRLVPLPDIGGADGNLIACTPSRLDDIRRRLAPVASASRPAG